jgi:hypothetical protein
MRFAYADPPYLGQCKRYAHRHDEPWNCWDDLETHRKLVGHLEATYPDGWAMSATSVSLPRLLPLCASDVRVGAWVKPWCTFKPSVNIAYAWEPLIWRGGRPIPRRERPGTAPRDWVAANALGAALGSKPPRFCRWVLDLLGYIDGDTVDDLFPGKGVMAHTLAQGVLM